MKSLIKKLFLGSLSLVFALSLTLGLSGALKTYAEGETETSLFTGAHITLTDDIVIKFDYTVPTGYTTADYTFTYMGKAFSNTAVTVTEGENVLEFAEANPARIGQTIAVSLTLTDGGNTITDSCEFSVASYLDTLLTASPSTFAELKSQEQYVAMRTLVANLVNYSAKTQQYIGNEDTSSAILKNETVKNLIEISEPAETDLVVGTLDDNAKYGFIGANLSLDGKVNVNFYFVAESKENLTLEVAFDGGSTTTLTNIEEATEITVKDGVTAYKAVLSGVSAIDMDKKFTAKLLSNGTAVGNEVTYSVKSYAYSMLSSKNDNMKSLALALYNYGLSAKTYVDVMAKDYTINLPVKEETAVFSAPINVDVKSTLMGSWLQPGGMHFASSLTSDGEYLYSLGYYASVTAVDGNYTNSFRFLKYNVDGSLVGYSQAFSGVTKAGSAYRYGGLEYYTPLWLKDGYAYSYTGDGKTIRVATSSLTGNDVAYEEVEDIKFGTAETNDVNAVVYNATNKKYIVMVNGAVSIYNEDDTTTAIATGSDHFYVRITADDDFIYVSESANGAYSPTIYAKNWSFNNVFNFKVQNDTETTGLSSDNISKTKLQGLAICNGELYYQLITWSTNTAAIFKASKSGTVSNYSVGDVLNCSAYDQTATNVTGGWNANNGSLILNAVQKNNWIYSVRNVYGSTKGYLVRYNYLTNYQVAVSPAVDNLRLGTEDSAVFTYDDKVYLYDVGNKVWLSLPLLFRSGDAWTTESSAPVALGDYATNFENIYVFEDLGLVAVYVSGKIVILKDGVAQTTYTVSTAAKNRMGGGKNGYLYYTANAESTLNPKVVVINVKNGSKNEVSLVSSLESASKSAITSIFELDGKLFYSMFTWGLSGGTLKSNMQSVSFSNVSAAKLPFKQLGEIVIEGKALSASSSNMYTISGTVKGVVTDGVFFYMANCTSAGKVKILKVGKSGSIFGQTAEFDNGSSDNTFGDTTYLLYKNGYIYAYSGKISEKVYRIKADDITADGTATVTETTEIAFTDENNSQIAIHAMAYDSVNNRYAVRNGDTLYLIDGTTNKAYKTVAIAANGTKVSVALDDNYVYALYEKTGGIAFVVYDWSGNKVGEVWQAGFIKEETSNANIPAMVIEDGMVYIFAKPWQGTYAYNVIFYTIDLNNFIG